MGKIVNSTYATLDGLVGDPVAWSLDYFDADAGAYALKQLQAADALLMGRRTYEGFAAAWPQRGGDEFSDRMNALPKYVASTTLTDPAWAGTTVLDGDLVESVRALKDRTEGDVLMYGYGPVARTLVDHGLLDELRLWVHPLLHGRGERSELLFQPGSSARFALLDTTALATGVVVLTYGPAV